MKRSHPRPLHRPASVAIFLTGAAALALAGCGGSSRAVVNAAQPGALQHCADLAGRFTHAGTRIASTAIVAAGELAVAGAAAVPEHCLVRGEMNRRTSEVDGQSYAIGFEMRLPTAWNGRYYYQANGGVDGSVVTATGPTGGGAPRSNALSMGFAVISSDAGHQPAAPYFGLDPQARLDYGYAAVGTLTPMAKNLIHAAYGRGPDRSYIGGCSNGGRHVLAAAARYGDQYDGFLAGAPGMHLPKSAVAQLWKAQQYASIASATVASGANEGLPDIASAVTAAEWSLLGSRIAARCDALDGAVDGMVQDMAACQLAFDIQTDVPTCSGARDGTCLTPPQKDVLARIFAGAVTPGGQAIYSRFPWDAGVAGSNYAMWHYTMSTERDPGAVAFIFNTPPLPRAEFSATTGLRYALGYDLDAGYQRIFATTPIYAESSWSFMTPPGATDLSTLRGRGAKVLVYHGVADAIFSASDSADWYAALDQANAGRASDFARLFMVPGMNHCSGGPSADQFDAITALVNWVEQGEAPARIVAAARGPGANVVNAEVPADWGQRTRPLCAWPAVARYNGTGDPQDAASFSCR
ncbi:MAG: tannase/feruloyl esterase family alpha/beta hydrolase [Pseudomonadota bacterium]|nr:tannase/feruloyl esterase family alpha/beta hydrolase [Pseudomonadota bacterium]